MRLFFALWPPEDLSHALAAGAETLARRFGGKPAHRETIHLTLDFLGEVDAERLHAVVESGYRVDAAPFKLVVDHFDCWRHNNLLWAGCAAPADGLRSLVACLREQLRTASFVSDMAPCFVPHLTLVRRARVPYGEIKMPPIEPLVWSCSGFVLAHSRPATTGRQYAILESFPLSAG
jgi:2'-5' RNA ligase